MLLSMWMLVNHLTNRDIEIHIRAEAPRQLRSARLSDTPGCLWISKKGNDTVCRNDEDFFLLRDTAPEEALELVQTVFDSYNDWDMQIREALLVRDYQRVVDCSCSIFNNPVVLGDADLMVMNLSRDFNIDNKEWKNLVEHSSLSLNALKELQQDRRLQMHADGARYFTMKKHGLADFICVQLTGENTFFGRLSVLGYNRKLERGDIQALDYLAGLLCRTLSHDPDRDSGPQTLISRLAGGEAIDRDLLYRHLSLKGWADTKDTSLCTVCLSPLASSGEEMLSHLARRLSPLLPEADIFPWRDTLILLCTTEYRDTALVDVLAELELSTLFSIGSSLRFHDVSRCSLYCRQALYAAQKRPGPGPRFGLKVPAGIFMFYYCAAEYLLSHCKEEELYCACHPDARRLEKEDLEHHSENLLTLRTYLDCERNMKKAADALFIHRNTLVYRIGKLLDSLICDLDDAYSRNYLRLSLGVLQNLRHE